MGIETQKSQIIKGISKKKFILLTFHPFRAPKSFTWNNQWRKRHWEPVFVDIWLRWQHAVRLRIIYVTDQKVNLLPLAFEKDQFLHMFWKQNSKNLVDNITGADLKCRTDKVKIQPHYSVAQRPPVCLVPKNTKTKQQIEPVPVAYITIFILTNCQAKQRHICTHRLQQPLIIRDLTVVCHHCCHDN